MTLENMILEQLGAGPVRSLELTGADPDEVELTLKFMVARRQICRKAGQISLFWHRHMIFAPPVVVTRKTIAPAGGDAAAKGTPGARPGVEVQGRASGGRGGICTGCR
jgi:hypothetical protein